jgi:uncharacterized protein YjdB
MRAFILAVTGLAIGVAACNSYGTSTIEVEKARPVATVAVTLPSPSLVAGQKERANAEIRDADGVPLSGRAVLWYSSSSGVATVSDSGLISAVSAGNVTVSAVSEGVTGQAAMSVMPQPPAPVAKVLVAITPAAVLVGQSAHATATLQDSSGNDLSSRVVTWQSSNQSVATISGNGDVLAVAPGNVTITAASEGKTASASLSVSAPSPVPVATVSVSPVSSTVSVGSTVQFSATTRDAGNTVLSGRVVSWTSGNPAVATVSASGLVTAVAAGTAAILATSEGQSGSGTLTVNAPAPVPVASISVSPSAPSIQVGATVQLSAVTRDAGGNVLTGRAISWSSSNTSVATVSSSGLVSALAAGLATITATSGTANGTSALTVTLVPVASISVSPSAPSIQVGAIVQLSAVTRDASGNVLTGRAVTWSSSNNTIATVSASGLVSALAAGPATVTATSGTANGTSVVTVSPAAPPPSGSPEPGSGDVMLWQDNFDKATLTELGAPYAKRGNLELITNGHAGSAARFRYTSDSFDNLIEKSFDNATDVYFRYYYRLSPGADPTCGGRGIAGFKWFMPWRYTADRYTMGVGDLEGGPPGFENTGLEFATHDNTSTRMPNPFMQNINKSKTFKTTADGAWHEYTLHVVTGNGGYEQIWIDGVLVLDSSGYGYDHSPDGIGFIQFPGAMVSFFAGCDWTIDVDDLAIWHK